MGLRIIWASVSQRWRRVLVACLAVTLGVSLPAAVVSLGGVEEKFERELKAYGANLLIVPRIGSSLAEGSLALLDQLMAEGRLEAYAPLIALVAKVEGRDVAVAGTPFTRAKDLYRWWNVEGAWPQDASHALIGANVAAKLGRRPGDTLTVSTRGATVLLRVAGVLSTGGSEENQVFVGLGTARALAGHRNRLSLVQARARRSGELASVREALAAAMPDAEVRTPFQVAKAEEKILGRLQRLLLLVTSLVLSAAALGVFATAASAALERRREVGVLKALGAEEKRVVRLFAAETIAMGLTGGVLGFGLGLLMAEAIAWPVFGTFIAPSARALGVSLAVGLGVSLGASLPPIRRAARVAPVAVLRGE